MTLRQKQDADVSDILDTMRFILDKKAADYSNQIDRYSAFTGIAEQLQRVRQSNLPDVDMVFLLFIHVKLTRLIELLSRPGVDAQNESVDDTFVDLANYCVLWGAYHRE